MSEPSHQKPVRIGEETLTTMSLRFIAIIVAAAVAVTGWALNQTMVGNRHTEQITEIQSGMKVLTRAMAKEHEVLRDLQADKREIKLQLDYLVNGRRGPVPQLRIDSAERVGLSTSIDPDPGS